MKSIFYFFITFVASTFFCHAEAVVSGIQEGHPLHLTKHDSQQVEKSVTALLISSDYEAAKSIASQERWQQALEASHVRVVYSEPQTFSFRFSTAGPARLQAVSVSDILIPISHEHSPDYVLIRFRDHVRAFAMFHDIKALASIRQALNHH